MTSCVVGTPSLRQGLVKLIDETEINSVVIDVKDFSGTISFDPQDPDWEPAWAEARCGAQDMKEFLATLHEKGIFIIARVTVFQDPFYTSKHPELAVKKLMAFRSGKIIRAYRLSMWALVHTGII